MDRNQKEINRIIDVSIDAGIVLMCFILFAICIVLGL